MRVLLSGASGLVGSALSAELRRDGHDVWTLVRRKPEAAREIEWDPQAKTIDYAKLEGFDAFVHLSGENVAGHRWNEKFKRRIADSRILSTRFLVSAIAGLKRRPKILITASAVGYYGNRGAEALDESSKRGEGFLADTVEQWENAARDAEKLGLRTAQLRFGVVLSKKGGALRKMLPPFRLGLGGPIGSGTQYMSWIALQDVVAIIGFALAKESLHGPINVTAPQAVTNREFTKTLGAALHRPAIIPLPARIVRILFGEMGETLLLGGAAVTPKKLLDIGFQFRLPKLVDALSAELMQNRS